MAHLSEGGTNLTRTGHNRFQSVRFSKRFPAFFSRLYFLYSSGYSFLRAASFGKSL